MKSSLSTIKSIDIHNCSPLPWNFCFEKRSLLSTSPTDIFRIYSLGNDGPIILLLHGGGYSALTWSLFAGNLVSRCICQVYAFDARAHGQSLSSNQDDLSWERLTQDVLDVFNQIVSTNRTSITPVVLIGHSMGGAIAIRVTQSKLLASQIGLIIIDVVEGTALTTLPQVKNFLKERPQIFNSVRSAIEWSIKSGQVKNVLSARVSVPGQLKCENSSLSELGKFPLTQHQLSTTSLLKHNNMLIETIDKKNDIFYPSRAIEHISEQNEENMRYTWKIDLSRTEKHWFGWFKGLSSSFLSCTVPKILIVAGVESLDRELTIGQMQGKFQFHVIKHVSHVIHEDAPEKVSEIVSNFLIRHKFAIQND